VGGRRPDLPQRRALSAAVLPPTLSADSEACTGACMPAVVASAPALGCFGGWRFEAVVPAMLLGLSGTEDLELEPRRTGSNPGRAPTAIPATVGGVMYNCPSCGSPAYFPHAISHPV
jgi:hypothetical protein